MLHGTIIEDIAFTVFDETFYLPEKIKDGGGKGPDRVYRAALGTAEGTVDGLRNCGASLVIKNRHRYVVITLSDKIEFASESNSIMLRRQGAVPIIGLPFNHDCLMISCNLL